MDVRKRLFVIPPFWHIGASQSRRAALGHIGRNLNLEDKVSHSRKQARLQQRRRFNIICFGVGLGLGYNIVQVLQHVIHAGDTLIVDGNTHGVIL